MNQGVFLSCLLAGALLWPAPASAGRVCKDGFVVSTGSRADKDRTKAEASAWRSWRAASGKSLDLPDASLEPSSKAKPKPQMECLQDSDEQVWRCHVRAERCKPA